MSAAGLLERSYLYVLDADSGIRPLFISAVYRLFTSHVPCSTWLCIRVPGCGASDVGPLLGANRSAWRLALGEKIPDSNFRRCMCGLANNSVVLMLTEHWTCRIVVVDELISIPPKLQASNCNSQSCDWVFCVVHTQMRSSVVT